MSGETVDFLQLRKPRRFIPLPESYQIEKLPNQTIPPALKGDEPTYPRDTDVNGRSVFPQRGASAPATRRTSSRRSAKPAARKSVKRESEGAEDQRRRTSGRRARKTDTHRAEADESRAASRKTDHEATEDKQTSEERLSVDEQTPTEVTSHQYMWRYTAHTPTCRLRGPGVVAAGFRVTAMVDGVAADHTLNTGAYPPRTEVAMCGGTDFALRLSNVNAYDCMVEILADDLNVGMFVLPAYREILLTRPSRLPGKLHFLGNKQLYYQIERELKIDCTFYPVTDLEIVKFRVWKGFESDEGRPVELVRTNTVKDLINAATIAHKTQGSNYRLYPKGDAVALALDEQFNEDYLLGFVPEDLYFIDRASLQFHFRLSNGRIAKQERFRRNQTLHDVIESIGREWYLRPELIYLRTERGLYHWNSLPLDRHLMNIFNTRDVVKSRGILHIDVLTVKPEHLTEIRVEFQTSGEQYSFFMELAAPVRDLRYLIASQAGVDESRLQLLLPDRHAPMEDDVSLDEYKLTADRNLVVCVEPPKDAVFEEDEAGSAMQEVVQMKYSEVSDKLPAEAYRLCNLDVNSSQRYEVTTGFPIDKRNKVKLAFTIVDPTCSSESDFEPAWSEGSVRRRRQTDIAEMQRDSIYRDYKGRNVKSANFGYLARTKYKPTRYELIHRATQTPRSQI